MFGSDALLDSHQPLIDVQRIDTAKGSEHLAQFESDKLVSVFGDRGVAGHDVFVRLPGQTKRLKDHGDPPIRLNRINLLSVRIQVERSAGRVRHKRSGNVTGPEPAVTGDALRPLKHLNTRRFVDQVRVAGVHVDRRNQSGLAGAFDVSIKRRPVDRVVIHKRQ